MRTWGHHASFLLISLLVIGISGPAAGADDVFEHGIFKPMPNSRVRGKVRHQQWGEAEIWFEVDGKRQKVTVSGELWYVEYEIVGAHGKRDQSVAAAEIRRNYESETERLGGTVFRQSGSRSSLKIPGSGGASSYCGLYVGNGYYTLTIVDEKRFHKTLTLGAEAMRDSLLETGHVAVYGIHFDTDKATLRPGSGRVLDEVARVLDMLSGHRFEIQGHTDNTGTAEHNLDLSDRRAQTIVDVLMLYGADRARLKPMGYGETKPIATNDTPEGRARNRRAEILLIE